jgi:hypothetical protein
VDDELESIRRRTVLVEIMSFTQEIAVYLHSVGIVATALAKKHIHHTGNVSLYHYLM